MTQIVEHHTHYKEIHGFDRTIWMDKGEHSKLHHQLRKEGKCNIPADELSKISMAANYRTGKDKKSREKYSQKYHNSKHGKNVQQKYLKNTVTRIDFTKTMMPNVQYYEDIRYNYNTGNISVSCNFRGQHGKKLYYVNI